MKNNLYSGVVFVIAVILMLSFVVAHVGEEVEGVHDDSEIPDNIKKVQEYNNQQADFYFKNLSFLIAFLAGIIGILTPCSLAILPAFFAYSFNDKREITKRTFSFFLGFMPVFVIFGLLATFLGKSLSIFQSENSFFVTLAGVVIIIFGLMVLFGKGFSGIKINKKTDKSNFGVFLFGVLFAIGFTACMGPILVGIVLIAGVLQSYFYAGVLMLFYSLGLFVPLFLISIFFDKYNFSGFMERINKKLGFPLTNLISGILLIAVGIVFILYKGTSITNRIGWGNFTVWIYSVQNKIIEADFINLIGILILVGFLYLLWKVLRKKREGKNGKE